MHEDEIIFSAKPGDNSIQDENLQAKEFKEAYGEIEYFEEVVCSTSSGFTGDFQRKEVAHQDDARDRENTEKEDDPPLYPSCPLRLSESILLIMTLAIRHKLTGDALGDVIKLVDLHCVPGPNSHSVKTLRELKSYFTNSKESLDLFYYCKCCYSLLPTEHTARSNSRRYNDAIIPCITGEGFYEDLSYRFTRPKTADCICDVYDGNQYHKLFSKGGVLSDQNNLSLKVNTDGVPIFKSSGFSLWPIFFEINELPPKKRRQVNNLVMGGLWFGEHKPVMGTFLKPFQEALSRLEIQGTTFQLPNKETIMSKVYLVSGIFDLPAKSMVLEEIQYNGFCGCTYCVEAGKSVKAKDGGRGWVHVYPFNDESETGHAERRTHKGTIANGKKSLQDPLGKPVFGVRGVCQFASLKYFDVVDGVAVDYMHGILLGVSKQLLKLWLDSQFSGEDWYCGTLVALIDDRLMSIKPPNVITRVPRSLEHHRKYWKASELRSWLFHYSLPCLRGILPEKYLNHYLLLVNAIWLLNQESITKEDLACSNFCLLKFVLYFDGLYGERHLTINVHNLLHVHRSVSQLGPLWANSSFEFEDANGDLKALFHGSQNIDMQIVTSISAMQSLPELSRRLEKDSPAAKFYSKLKFGAQSKVTPIGQGIFKLGAASKCSLALNIKAKLVQSLGMMPFGTVKKFRLGDRCFIARRIHGYPSEIVSLWYTKRRQINLSPMDRFSSSCSINHHVHIGHYIPVNSAREHLLQ
ncbi:uncharacterized protein LOC141866757 [Acropora palmata]|uniref:uncharacterized protein LOC141866757 n=1 Tax=Acropora palmata TaxID=6131 RepID=UPI003DA073F8